MKIERILVYSSPSALPEGISVKDRARALCCEACQYSTESFRIEDIRAARSMRICTYPFKMEECESGNDCLGRALDLDEYQAAFELLMKSRGSAVMGPVCDRFELVDEVAEAISSGSVSVISEEEIEIPSVDEIIGAYRQSSRTHSRDLRLARELVTMAMEGYEMPERQPGLEIPDRPHMKEILGRLSHLAGQVSPAALAEACEFLLRSERKWLQQQLLELRSGDPHPSA